MLKGSFKLRCNVCECETPHFIRCLDQWKEIQKLNCYECSSFVIIREGVYQEWHYKHLGEWAYERLV